ncbi:hypothetical protein AKJ16_DCAP20698 [Drosera capensis]
MTGMSAMKVVVNGIGATALAVGGGGVGALVLEEIGVRLGEIVKKDAPKLSNGFEKRSWRSKLKPRMRWALMVTLIHSSHRDDMDIDEHIPVRFEFMQWRIEYGLSLQGLQIIAVYPYPVVW